MPLLGESNPRQGFSAAVSGYEIENSTVLHDGDTDQFTRTFDITPSNQKKFTVSMWFKRSDLDVGDHLFGGVGASATTGRVQVYFDGSDQLVYEIYHGSGWNTVKTNQVFTDPNAWYNIMIVYDVDNAVSLDKMRVYLNGSRITSFATHNPPSSSLNHLMFSNSQPTIIGNSGDNAYFDGYIAEVIGLDGRALTSMSPFGENNDEGVWIPKDPTNELAVSTTAEAIVNTTSAVSGTDTAAYTFSSVALGTASTDRAVYVWTSGQGPSVSAFNVNTMTVGGVSASLVQVADSSAEPQYMGELWRADVPTGTTGDIVVTWNSALSQCGISVWSVTGDHEEFAIATDLSNSTSSVSFTNVPDNSVILAGRGSTSSVTHTWSADVTENVDQTIEGSVTHSAASKFHATGGSKTVTCTPSGTDSRARMVAIVLSPKQGTGRNGFYLPFTQSTFLGADYATTATQTTFNSASDWTGTTGAYTFTQGSIEAGTSDKAVKSVQTFAGDFEFQWRYVTKANWIIGVYDTAEDGTFNDSNSSGGMASMTDSFYVQASSVAGNNDILYGGSEVVDTTTISNGDTWKIGRVGSQIKVYRNGSVLHTFSQTNSDTMRMVFAQGDTSADADHISWVDGTGTVGKNVFALGSPTQSVDTPTNNFPTHNFLFEYYTSGNTSYYRPDFGVSLLADGNLELDTNSPNTPIVYSNMAFPSSGKFYFEVICNPSSAAVVGIGGEDTIEDGIGGTSTTGMANVIGYYATNGTKFNQSGTASAYGNASSIANGEFIGVAVDFDNDAIWFCDNGTWVDGNGTDSSATVLAEIVAGTTTSAAATSFATDQSSWFPMVAAVGDYPTMTINFGQSSYTGAAPTGFKNLKTGNLPEPAIKDPTEHFQVLSYTGNGTAIGSGGLSVNQDGNSTFQPDLVWVKNYDTNGNENVIYDSIRGGTKVLFPSTTQAEVTVAEGVTAFESDGFKVGNSGEVNTSSDGHVAWMWKAADAWSESAFGSNGLASSGKRNTTAGFSIATWTHRTSANYAIKHGLSITPEFFIIKSRDSGTNWELWHKDLVDTGKRIVFDTGGEITAYWADASDSADGTGSYADIATNESPVTATLFALQDGDLTGADAVMGYFWHGIAGYSKFGTYKGNGVADGIFVELGFKPALLVIRESGSSGDHWAVYDNKRDTFNDSSRNKLNWNSNHDHANIGAHDIDFLSNGFKLRTTDGHANANGDTYIYAAWADTPFGGDGVSEATAV